MKRNKYKNLREYFEKTGISRKEFASLVGISECYLSFYFHGKKTFGAKLALKISKLTGIPMQNLYPKEQ